MELTSYKAMEDMLDGVTLEDFQCVDIIKCWVYGKNIIIYDTGMGKTLIAAAAMRGFINQVPSRRYIMFVEKSQLLQTPGDIRRWAGLSVLPVTAQTADITQSLIDQNFLKYQVLMLTHDTLDDPRIMNLLYKNKSAYHGVFIDEAHKLCNFRESQRAGMLRGMLRQFEVRFALTATPITSNMRQVADLMHMIDWHEADDVNEIIKEIELGHSPLDRFPKLFINRTRRDLGIISNYRTHIELVEPHPGQEKVTGNAASVGIKGPGGYNQVNKLIDILLNNKDRRGLIYIRHHSVREWVLTFLDKADISYACVNGRVTNLDTRRKIVEDFRDNKIDVIITSVTSSLNLDCDYVVFYEFCTDIKQMMGRAERGLNPKALDLYFIFTQKTAEIDQFVKNIYHRSLSIQEVLKKDYSQIISAGDKLTSAL